MKRVQYLTAPKNLFSDVYIAVRKKENRLYDDEIIKNLPNTPQNHIYKSEWDLRIKSTNRIINYLKNKKQNLRVLDLGCGNGWFSNQLSKVKNSAIFAVDINPDELEQGNRIFQQDNLTFIYADIFNTKDNLNGFDIITINSCIQYFNNISTLIETLKTKLKPNGEIHILDSPFYKPKEIEGAKKRTKSYYTSLGYPEMADNYYHYSLNELGLYEILYNPKKTLIDRIVLKKDIPFPWLMLE